MVRAYDPAAGERAATLVPGLEVVADPYDACDGRRRARGAHRVGRVPLARLRPGRAALMRAPGDRRRPQPARPGRAAPARLRLRGRRPLVDRSASACDRPSEPRASSPAAPASSARTSAERLLDDGLGRRRARQPAHRPPRERRPSCSARPEFTFEHYDVTNFIHVDRRGRRGAALREPGEPADYLEHPIETLKVGALGTHNTLGLARGEGRAVPARVDERGLRRPARAPAAREYWGNVNPIGPRGVYDEAKRFAEALTMAYHRAHGLDVAIVRIFNTYGPRLRPADGRVVSNFLVQAMEGKPLTIYGDGTQTRSFCYVDDEVRGHPRPARLRPRRPGEHRQPGRVHDPRAGRARARGHRLDVGDRVRAAARRRPDAAPARHHAGARACSAGSREVAAARRSRRRTLRVVPEGARAVARRASRRRPGDATGKLSVIVPVFNERNTVVEILRRMRAVELPGSTARSSSSTTAATTAPATVLTPARRQHRAGRHAPAEPGKGAADPHRARARRPATSCSSRTPTSSTTPRTGRSCSRRCSRARRSVVYGSRFTGERRNMLFLHWVGNRFLSLVTNVLYNTTLSDMETCYKLFDREVLDGITLQSDRFDFEPEITAKVLRAGHPHLRGADLLRRPRVRRGQEDHLARRLRGAVDARQVPLRRVAVTADAGRPAGPRSSSTTRPGRSLADVRRVAARRRRRRAPPRSSSSTTARRDGSVAALQRALPRRAGRSCRRGNLGYGRAANLGIAATRAPSSRC